MITGYNTDVRHAGRSFHVQTEDKGESNPYIESLIYVGGQVLAAKRTDYAEALADGAEEKAITELMDRQHGEMISAIQNGDYDAQVVELFGEVKPSAGSAEPKGGAAAASERTLDEVILDYLATEAESERMVLQLEEEVEIVFGVTTALRVRTCLSKSGLPISGAEVMIKMISTLTEPRVLATGITDDDGLLQIPVQLPELARGNSALIITAGANDDRAELKYLL
ncbi:MAG: hypothetical protein DWQ36_22575 [Acidobacteria bacterium]|nr:MAG: hypothetical protein DWQ30_13695 [Acidobacteriota bacterium]REK00547.1 MAG: hypothetical protein DWQ36_22575 [Acidobacteriota bacterium]